MLIVVFTGMPNLPRTYSQGKLELRARLVAVVQLCALRGFELPSDAQWRSCSLLPMCSSYLTESQHQTTKLHVVLQTATYALR